MTEYDVTNEEISFSYHKRNKKKHNAALKQDQIIDKMKK